jgi:hypothetical protein
MLLYLYLRLFRDVPQTPPYSHDHSFGVVTAPDWMTGVQFALVAKHPDWLTS